MKLAKKGIALLFVLLLAIGTAVPALAADRVTLTLQVRIGSTSALVNGEKQVIEKPYVQNGMTMVPLGVFQRAFGTTSRLEGDDIVRMTYGSRALTFTIGSKTAWVNGKKTALTAAPVMKNGTLMVPLRPVTDMLQAKVKYSSGTIVATLVSDNGIPGKTPAEEPANETARVGSSYADWSIDYPSDTVAQPGDDEFSALISDPDGSYMLQIRVWQEDIDVPVSDMLEQLEQESIAAGETILDEEAFPNADVPYARIVTRDLDGIYWEARRYYDEGKVYSLYLGDSIATGYRDFEEWAPLLDSFRPSFATPGLPTEDLSEVRNGYMDMAAPDYGLSMKIPAGWAPTGNGTLEYQGDNGSFLTFAVTSASEGETLDDWHELLQTRMNELFLPGYADPIVSESVQASGQDAIIEKLTYDLGGGGYHWNWLVLKQQGYFYVLSYFAPEEAYSEQVFGQIVDSVEIDFEAVPSSFGKLGQISYLKDKALNVTQSTQEFRLRVPAYWTLGSVSNLLPELRYSMPGGSMGIAIVETGLEAAAAEAARKYADLRLDDPTLAYGAPNRTVFAGMPAIRIAYTGTDGDPYRAEDIYFRHDGMTYWIHYRIAEGAATPEQLEGIERALQSFKFF